MAKKLRCLLGLHSWVERVREGERYYECRHCGKYHETAWAIFRYPGSRP
ncbi:MAG TPA: hypothetical protein VF895_05240 [Gaiellaceae bacterium]